MSCRDKTYVIFDGECDRWARARMMSWKSSNGERFNLYQAHDLLPIAERIKLDVLKLHIWQRLGEAQQVIVLVGEKTRHCRFALCEIDLAQTLRLPIIVVNLNGWRGLDPVRCPELLIEWPALHVEFKERIVEAALEHFPAEYARLQASAFGARRYPADMNRNLSDAMPFFTWLKQTPTPRC